MGRARGALVSRDAGAMVFKVTTLSPGSTELAWNKWAHSYRGQEASQNKSNPHPGPERLNFTIRASLMK